MHPDDWHLFLEDLLDQAHADLRTSIAQLRIELKKGIRLEREFLREDVSPGRRAILAKLLDLHRDCRCRREAAIFSGERWAAKISAMLAESRARHRPPPPDDGSR